MLVEFAVLAVSRKKKSNISKFEMLPKKYLEIILNLSICDGRLTVKTLVKFDDDYFLQYCDEWKNNGWILVQMKMRCDGEIK